VSLDSLNIHLDIPILSKARIGLPVNLAMHYNSNSWIGFQGSITPVGDSVAGGFWILDGYAGLTGTFQMKLNWSCSSRLPVQAYTSYTDPQGTVHTFANPVIPLSQAFGTCPKQDPVTVSLTDGSGLTATVRATAPHWALSALGTGHTRWPLMAQIFG
jgi:hypothetical protein